MAQKIIATDGTTTKTINPWDTESYPEAWSFFGNAPVTQQMEQYARVAAVFGAYNLTADTIGNIRRVLYNKAGKEVDDTLDWQNTCGFLPNPSELYRLAALSYIYSNKVYDIVTSDGLGYKTKNIYHAIPDSFIPYVSPSTGLLEYVERQYSAKYERFDPEGNLILGEGTHKLIRMWRLDQSTEVLPSQHTEAKAIMSAAGIVYYADFWIQNFFRRGGIKPTLIAMKGLVNNEAKEESESKWDKFIRGIGKFASRTVGIYNAETMDIKPFGSGVDDMKDNKIYEQALENIAIGKRMPLSLLKANSANRATALEEKRTWFENYINPLCGWLDYEYNKQLWIPRGYRIKTVSEFDDETEDEQERSDSIMKYMDIIEKSASFEVFMGVAEMMKIEIPERLEKALMQVFEDRKKAQQEAQALTVDTQNGEEDTEDEPVEEVPAKSIKANETSAMIALRIPNAIREEIRARYSFVDEETLNNLHITLVYLGDNRTLDKMDAVRAVSDFGMYQSPIKGRLQGLARFVNGTETDPLVVTFDSPQMPVVYETLCDILDNYHVPYHRTHGFIPHMTLAYIASDAEMPIETIEPIEINFSDVYLVDGNVWLPADFTGMENKTTKAGAAKWIPSIDEQNELRVWAEVALRRLKKGEPLDFEYQPHYNGLPDNISNQIKAELAALENPTPESVKAIFDKVRNSETSMLFAPQVKQESEILALAAAMNKLADANLTHKESDKE